MSSSASTPSLPTRKHKHSKLYHGSSGSTSSPTPTARQQDAQARNKDWEEDSSDSSTDGRSTSRSDRDTYETKQKKREAAIILDSPDLLMMYSQARGDSVPGTRLFYMKQLCGYEDIPKAPIMPSRSVAKEKERERIKGKGRKKSTP